MNSCRLNEGFVSLHLHVLIIENLYVKKLGDEKKTVILIQNHLFDAIFIWKILIIQAKEGFEEVNRNV